MTGPELKAFLKSRRINVSKLARDLGVTSATIHNWFKAEEVKRIYLYSIGAILYGLPPVGGQAPEYPTGNAKAKSIEKKEELKPCGKRTFVEDLRAAQDREMVKLKQELSTDLWARLR